MAAMVEMEPTWMAPAFSSIVTPSQSTLARPARWTPIDDRPGRASQRDQYVGFKLIAQLETAAFGGT